MATYSFRNPWERPQFPAGAGAGYRPATSRPTDPLTSFVRPYRPEANTPGRQAMEYSQDFYAMEAANRAEREAQLQRQRQAEEWARINSQAVGPTASQYNPNAPLEAQPQSNVANPYAYRGRIVPYAGPDQALQAYQQNAMYSTTVPTVRTPTLSTVSGNMAGPIGVGGDVGMADAVLNARSGGQPLTTTSPFALQDAATRYATTPPTNQIRDKFHADLKKKRELETIEQDAAYQARLRAAQNQIASLQATTDGTTPPELKRSLDAIMTRYISLGRYGAPEMYQEIENARRQYELSKLPASSQYAFFDR